MEYDPDDPPHQKPTTGPFGTVPHKLFSKAPNSSTSSENRRRQMNVYSAIVCAIGIAFRVALALFPKTAPKIIKDLEEKAQP